MNAVYARRFQEPWPVRTTFGVAFLAAEPGHETVRVQLDCVASTIGNPSPGTGEGAGRGGVH
jgi:hypothetical protein